MPIRKKYIKAVNNQIFYLKKKLNKAKLDNRNLLRAHEDEDNLLQYHFHKYNINNHYDNRNGYVAYKKLKLFYTKIRSISDKSKDAYGITVGTNNPQFF